MGKVVKYHFHPVEHCNMCHAGPENFKIMGRRLNSRQGYFPHNKGGILVTVKQCKKCKLIFSDPMPIPDRFEDHYGVPAEEYWKESHEDWWKIPEYFVLNRTKYVNHIIKLGPESKILDVGAGAGQVMKAFQDEGYDIYGIEPSEPFCRFIIEKMGVKAEKLKNVSIEDAEFPEGNFDFINLAVVLEHLYDPSAAINKMIGWLKPEGILYIEVPSSKWLYGTLINFIYKLTGRGMVTNLSPMHPPYHLYEFSEESFRRNGDINGYDVQAVVHMNGDRFMPKLIDWPIWQFQEKTHTGMQLAVYLQRKKK